MSARALVAATMRQQLLTITRYQFELISGLITIYVLFALVFFGTRAFVAGTAAEGETLPAIIVGFFTWTAAITAYQEVSMELTQEATAGTLEQLAMSPFGLPVVLTVRFLTSIAVAALMWATLLLLMMATTGRWLHIDVVSIAPLLVLTLFGAFGLGMILGGLALIFKRVQSVLQIVQFGFVALIAIPLEVAPWLKYLPLAWGDDLIEQVMVDGRALSSFPAGHLLFLLAHAAVWYVLGIVVFRWFERIARDRALLGHY